MNDLTLQARMQRGDLDPGASPEEKVDFLEYWRAVAKRRWSILALTLLVAVLTMLVVNGMRPMYRATSTLLIEQGKSKIVSIEEVYNQGLIHREYYQTQVEILKSEDLARKVAQKLKLTSHPDFDPRQERPSWLARLLGLGDQPPANDEWSEGDLLKAATQRVQGDLAVNLIRGSQLARVSFQAFDPELAAKVPNALAEAYIESDLEARMAMTQKATEWLRERMGELREKVDASERALQAFRDRERIVDVKGVAMSGASRQLEELTANLVEARQKRAEAESAYAMVQQLRGSGAYESVPAVMRNPLVQRMKEQEADAERRLNEAAKRYGPEHPKMIQAKADVESARENLRRQIQVVVGGLGKDYEAAKLSEAAIERALSQSKADIQSFNRKEFQLGVLEREVQQNRNLYEMFLNRLKETSAGTGAQTTVARIMDPATVPTGPFAPNKSRAVLIAALSALLLSAALALLLDRLSNTLNSTADVENRLSMPALGVLQKIKGFGKKGFISELAFFNDTQSTFAEAVRTVRTSILMSSLDEPHKVVVITSSVPEEGKTTLSFNLACALGQVKKVLLVDGDLRRPKIGRLVGRESKAQGLADLVAGQAKMDQCVFFEERAGIHILSSGTVPPNPLELLSSRRFKDVIAKLRESFDIVLIDSAPLQLVSDAQILSQYASSVIYVVKADSTPYQVAQNGLKKLRRVGAPVLGVVLNQLDLEKAEKYYGEYSGYKSYRGYRKAGYTKTYGAAE